MATLASVVTQVGYKLGETLGASSTPTSTEATQWLKDAQRDMIKRLPIIYLKGKYQIVAEAFDAGTYVDMSSYDGVLEIDSVVHYDDSASTYKNMTVLDKNKWNSLRYNDSNLDLHDGIVYYDEVNQYIYIYPSGETTNDIMYISFRENLNAASTDYELHDDTIPLAEDYACYIASLQSEDLIGMAEKYLTKYELGIKNLGGK